MYLSAADLGSFTLKREEVNLPEGKKAIIAQLSQGELYDLAVLYRKELKEKEDNALIRQNLVIRTLVDEHGKRIINTGDPVKDVELVHLLPPTVFMRLSEVAENLNPTNPDKMKQLIDEEAKNWSEAQNVSG